MSTLLHSFKGSHEVHLTQYSGGVKGLCVQVTGYNCDKKVGYVGMTKREARKVGRALIRWSRNKKIGFWERFVFAEDRRSQ